MLWKVCIFACLAVGVLAEYEVPSDKKEFIQNIIRTQCEKNGAADKASEVENAGNAFIQCASRLINTTVILKEIEEAKPNGALDEVFGKYCALAPQLKTCINNLLDSFSPCLDADKRKQVQPAKTGAEQLLDFVCYKDGDRIALFIAEGGPECFKEKANGIRACADKLKESVPSIEKASNQTVVETCTKYDELTACVVKSLEECSTPTPGNMAESLFKFVRKSTPCNTALPKN